MILTTRPGGDSVAVGEGSERFVRRLAVLTAVVSLAPIGFGSLVTTLGAGMAFPDWPTSNGQAMLAYPWLSSSGDKFVEHGHRLAGMLIGLCSVVLAACAWLGNARRSVRVMTLVVVVGVIVQGLIGGLRVRLDRQTIAFAHSVFGCLVFVALWLTALMAGQSWGLVSGATRLNQSKVLSSLAVTYPLLCFLQYVLGGFIRHLGSLVHEHLGGAIVVTLTSVVIVGLSRRSSCLSVRRAGISVGVTVSLQVAVGLAVWITKYGFPPLCVVAVQHSMLQIVSRSLHTVAGMSVVLSSVIWGITVWRVTRLGEATEKQDFGAQGVM
jgi:heme a synthase